MKQLIEEEKLNAIIEAGTYAATGMGKQSPIIIAVTDRAMRDRLSKMNAAVMGASMVPSTCACRTGRAGIEARELMVAMSMT